MIAGSRVPLPRWRTAAPLLLLAAAAAASPAPPPLASLAGRVLDARANAALDAPCISNAWGSVGVELGDVLSLSGLAVYPFAAALPADGTGFLVVDGEPAAITAHQWLPFAARRFGAAGAGGAVRVQSEVRLVFEAAAALVRVSVSANDGGIHSVTVGLQGLVQRLASYPWVTLPAVNAQGFAARVVEAGGGSPRLLTCDLQSSACSAWAFAAGGPAAALSLPGLGPRGSATMATAVFALAPGGEELELDLVLALAGSATIALADADAYAANFSAVWAAAQSKWESRWLDAFTPKSGGGGHFSGSLPVLAMDGSETGAAIERAYYMGALAVLQAERTNLPQFAPRTYVTASGNAVFLGAPWGPPQAVDIGNSAIYFWDMSFYPTLASLLDPEAQRDALLRFTGLNFSTTYGIEADTLTLTGHVYAFNAKSLFDLFTGYVRATNDTSMLVGAAGSYVQQLAALWRSFTRPNSAWPLLADYGPNPDTFLEAVPTYIHATAGLQAAAASMAFELGDLAEARGDAEGAGVLRAEGAAIARASIDALYVAETNATSAAASAPGDVGGWFAVLDTESGVRVEVRHVIDTIYAAAGFCGGAGARSAAWGCALSSAQRAQMADFARRQLLAPSGAWIRALSPLDALRNISRPDHGTTGAYDSWPSLLFEALTALDGGFASSVTYFAGVAQVALDGPFGQAHELDPLNGSAFKTLNGWTRYNANNGASFAEVVVRTLFGYQPPWLPPQTQGGDDASAAPAWLKPAFAGVPRGVGGALYGIRLPGGAGSVDALLTEDGVRFVPAGSGGGGGDSGAAAQAAASAPLLALAGIGIGAAALAAAAAVFAGRRRESAGVKGEASYDELGR